MTVSPDIKSLIPHAGSMCLLDGVAMFDDARIVCHASSHRDPANPLRHNNQLSYRLALNTQHKLSLHTAVCWQDNKVIRLLHVAA
jgi:predicted hotdog family 3-hydroxylacyl-ACP dehydratase